MPQSFHRSRSSLATTGFHVGCVLLSPTGRVAVASASVTIGSTGISPLILAETLAGMFDGSNE